MEVNAAEEKTLKMKRNKMVNLTLTLLTKMKSIIKLLQLSMVLKMMKKEKNDMRIDSSISTRNSQSLSITKLLVFFYPCSCMKHMEKIVMCYK